LAADAVRLHVLFSGTVQGVGFRYTARNVARRHEVTGFVRNLSDGRVEVVAEGEREEVLNFVADIEREMEGYITRAEKALTKSQKEFTSFGIEF
jgi:acylphosphatase